MRTMNDAKGVRTRGIVTTRTVKELSEFRDKVGRERTVGLVPTMGSFHEGHKRLIRRSVKECDMTIVTIFVNPLQFSKNEDLSKYPRQNADDIRVCEELGVSGTFVPNEKEMYDAGFDTTVRVGVGKAERNERSEGGRRPSHFEGVATVVTKLLIMSRPTVVYFGQKDGQQVCVMRRLMKDLFPLIEVRICETAREKDGVALSSRNAYLSRRARMEAGVIYRALKQGLERFEGGERDANEIRRVTLGVLTEARERLQKERDEDDDESGVDDGGGDGVRMDVEYVSVCDRWSMREVEDDDVGNVDRSVEWLLCVAITLDGTRLIDNLVLQSGRGLDAGL